MPSIFPRFGARAAIIPSDNTTNSTSDELYPPININWSMMNEFIESVQSKSHITQLSIGAISGFLSGYCFISISRKLAFIIGFGMLISEIYTGETWSWKIRIPSSMSLSQYLPSLDEFKKFVCNLGSLAFGFIGGALISISM